MEDDAERDGYRAEMAQASSDTSIQATKSKKRRSKDRSRTATPSVEVPTTDGNTQDLLRNTAKRRKSISNPGSIYANTLHSAGHTVLNRLAEHLGYAGFRKERELGNGLVSRPAITGSTGDWTLWQSTSYMNESGKGVRAAHTAWSKHIPVAEAGKLVVIYDELEKAMGVVTLRTNQGASAKGHNGLKSIMATLGNNVALARIGVGIGRPVSRDSNDVAQYVLKKMTPAEKAKIEVSVEEVVAKLKQLEKG
ncbi:hypothetical protein LTR78_006564 [Recurvomyces mirabilis]|uniref:peptidyl-tRNA hydrolase n=1 Tax=Recurvomyces mirabilis TaxID=574656 RepID=A0AAE1C063_9PEZI|nr:hypothetical protein LTR78_006564 [Recurvomyces mirabilis]KAK5151018.1 hypothetical protein LTS14_009513 [Recurvomyces mirabilis]